MFFTCSLTHLSYAGYGLTGQYVPDGHILPIDVLAVPGAASFLWLVLAVRRDRIGRGVDHRERLRVRLEPLSR